jgi:hypothetical protein
MPRKMSVAPFTHPLLQNVIQLIKLAQTAKIPYLLALLFLSGCASIQIPSWFRWAEVDLAIEVEPTNTPGSYSVRGRANLPENTSITVAAVRHLQLTRPSVDRLSTDRVSETAATTESGGATNSTQQTYSILAYQPATVQGGEWQTEINLWKVAADGRFKEAWQIEQEKVGVTFQPEDNVIFLATLSTPDKLSALEQELARRGTRFASGTVFSNSDGFRYAQVQQSLELALPSGRTTPPPERPEDRNGGWGDRYIIPNEPPNPTNLEFPGTRITDAPPAREEFLR